jgi:FlaA1/EpsC-like NDP-sugar epimerase
LRFEFSLPNRRVLLAVFPILALMRIGGFVYFRLLHGYWRYSGASDAWDIVKAVAVGSAGFLVVVRWVLGVTMFPRSVYILEALLTGVLLGAVRFGSRALMQGLGDRQKETARTRVIVVGAGAAAATLLVELPRSEYVAVGLVDDDRAKLGIRIRGVPVLGGIEELPELVERNGAHGILIAIPSATGKQMRRIAEYCRVSGVTFRTIPGLADLINGTVSVSQLREVRLEDLLSRDAIRLDPELVRWHIAGRVVMVTGAAGSIGSELCEQILRYQPARLLCVDQDESGLFFLEQRLQPHEAAARADYYVADVTDIMRMRGILETRGVEVILHAAAYKHVPMMESNVGEAVRNNIFGLTSLLDVAEHCGVQNFLLISSDKAVNPTNVMGCTKRVCELIMAARPSSRMRCISVRFGNVLGSQGSVVPVLQQQILNDHRVTVTHPEITRFFMTIPEAVSLVLQAFAVGGHGEILVLDMGEPVRILDLARTMIRQLGKAEDEIEIVYTGLRKGEKLYEELFYASETAMPTECPKVMRTRGQLMRWSDLHEHLEGLEELIYGAADSALRARLQEIVPEYRYEMPVTDVAMVNSTLPLQAMTKAATND